MKIPEAFKEAEVLAEFANIDPNDSNAVSYFRNNYPDFAPPEWWDYTTETMKFVPIPPQMTAEMQESFPDAKACLAASMDPIWLGTQEDIQTAWEREFQFASIFHLTELWKEVFVAPSDLVAAGHHLNLPDGTFAEFRAESNTEPNNLKMYTFYKAVLYLYHHPWRAKICKDEKCRKYFVANSSKREFCEYPDDRGETCRKRNDNNRYRAYYYEAGKEKRQKRNAKKEAAKKKTIRTRRSHGANGQNLRQR